MLVEAGTYVQVSREELEDWLDSIGYRGNWERDVRYSGVYLIHVSPTVAIKLSSTVGSSDEAMDVGRASMQLALVSRVTGRVLNKKAQGQSHFKRTLNWKKTWAAGIETMKKAYLLSSDFYDVISTIEDREKYKQEMLDLIKEVPGWDHDAALTTFHRKVEQGGVLMPREVALVHERIRRKEVEQPHSPENPQTLPGSEEGIPVQELKIDALRKLWVVAKRQNDDWTMGFAKDIAQKYVAQGRPLSGPQLRTVAEKLRQYRIPDLNGQPAFRLF